MSKVLLKKVVLLSCLLFCATSISIAQINKRGYASFKAYQPKSSNLTNAYLDISQDNRGVIFSADEQFIFQYDGLNALCHDIYGYFIVQCEPETGRVYVGGGWNFGYLTVNRNGTCRVESLLSTLPDSVNPQSIVIDDRIFFRNDTTFFLGLGTVVAYDRKNNRSEVWSIPEGARCAVMNNDIYTIKDHELCVVSRNGCIPQGTKFNKDIRFILDAEQIRFDEYLLTLGYEMRTYNPYTKKTKLLDIPPITDALKQHRGQVDKIQDLGKGRYAINNRGANKIGCVFVIDSTYHLVETFGKKAGARTNMAAGMHLSVTDSLLWVAGYDNSCIDINSPLRQFSHLAGFEGDITDLCFAEDGKVFVLTSEGAFYLNNNENEIASFITIPELDGVQCLHSSQYTDPYTHKPAILISTNRGVFKLDSDNKCTLIIDWSTNYTAHLSADPYHLYAYTTEMVRYNINRNGTMTFDESFEPIPCDYSQTDGDSIMIIRDLSLNAIRLNVITGEVIDLKDYSQIASISIRKGINDILVTMDSLHLYQFNATTRKYDPCKLVEGIIDYNNKYRINNVSSFGKGYVVTSFNEEVAFVYPKWNGKWQYQPIPGTIRSQASAFIIAPDSSIFMCSPEEIFSYKTDTEFKQLEKDIQKRNTPYNALVREVRMADSVIHYGNFVNEYGGFTTVQPDSLIPTIDYSNNRISISFCATTYLHEDLTKYSHTLEGQSKNWTDWDSKTVAEFTNLYEGKYTFKVKAKNVYGVESSVAEFSFIVSPPFYRTFWAYAFYCLLLGGALLGYNRVNAFRLKRRNALLQKLVEERTRLVRQHEAAIVSNINYASRIQKAALTPSSIISEVFPKNFIIYIPHSIVSGDFYVVTEIDNKQVGVVADCTGHGVSGGFLSMLGMSVIRQIVMQTLDPAEILDQLRQYVISNLHQHNEAWSIQDGMDATVFVIDKETKRLAFSGANTRLLIVRNGYVHELRGDRMPVAIHFAYLDKKYTNSYFDLQSDDMVYAFTDGIVDQFGGENNSKFMLSRFKNLLKDIAEMGMNRQQKAILTTFEAYKGNHSQTDDVLIMGVRIE